uniref:Uncharacterized protein n=1 Tax=Manihot esculenta TaxID=3983 RepID=A0A2C9U8D1_MANES
MQSSIKDPNSSSLTFLLLIARYTCKESISKIIVSVFRCCKSHNKPVGPSCTQVQQVDTCLHEILDQQTQNDWQSL